MATDLTTTNDSKRKNTCPACNSAPTCCWYETAGAFGGDCTNRTTLVCQLRREEVFSGQGIPSRREKKAFARANS
ncbi:MAG: hypothetical protein LBR80_06185 [Deltaproteobacteria bacterium]|jgi:hypothetical protein|nr:hypothetical protein [Deltaproteobacteria bacterium]